MENSFIEGMQDAEKVLVNFFMPGEIQTIIFTYIGSIADVKNLASTCTTMRNLFNDDIYVSRYWDAYRSIFLRNLESVVQPFGFLDLSSFDMFLGITGLELSGSLVLKSLIGGDWEGGDMDLYLDHDRMSSSRRQVIYDALFDFGYLQEYFWKPYAGGMNFCVGFTQMHGGRSLQVIFGSASVFDTIELCDFSFLKNIYAVNRQGQHSLLVVDPVAVVARESCYCPDSIAQMGQYQDLLSNSNYENGSETMTFLRHMQHNARRCLLRIKKYRSRGFNIENGDVEIVERCNEMINRRIKLVEYTASKIKKRKRKKKDVA